jgi:hypothetical protein
VAPALSRLAATGEPTAACATTRSTRHVPTASRSASVAGRRELRVSTTPTDPCSRDEPAREASRHAASVAAGATAMRDEATRAREPAARLNTPRGHVGPSMEGQARGGATCSQVKSLHKQQTT